ncbi:DNA recombination protein RmuC [Salinimicrobium marinum]|uniref:DNA recombination protein RmuC n=1 Tax=Salinimicrobium marinum TaxID=680283 RepID=A0A918SE85_9FLAO|nr:DNA recombination protein RmuC [Salinimicrobium marinum]GHA37100.1 DNA recombination protein RmuC [Salinimicrobium marinum]
MNELILIAGFLIVFAVGAFIGIFIANLKSKSAQSALEERNSQLNIQFENYKHQVQQQLEELRLQSQEAKKSVEKQLDDVCGEREEIRKEKDFLNNELTRRNSEFENLYQRNQEQKAEVEKLQEKFTKEFENLANKILDQKSEKFTLQNKENLQNILTPLQEKILSFEKRVEDTHKDSIGRNSQLQEQIRGLKELNEQMSKEAVNLTKALKGDSKMQGNWGELVLERVLEKSGLEKDREYFVQTGFTTEDGKRVLPDVVIHLPDNKKMIIDSKVSLSAYERFVNEEDEDLRAKHLRDHINSLKRHIEQLSSKNYHDLYKIESPSFVLLFVPIEPAFAVAINHDNSFYNWAFEKNIVIVTPATLLATLRTIDSMWTNEKQQRNALEIARQAGALYDKFHGLMTDLTTVGKKIDEAKDGYKSAMNKLFDGTGNLITRVEKLKRMGAKAKKSLPESVVRRASEENEEKTLN